MSWMPHYFGSSLTLDGQPRNTSGLVQFKRAPNVFESSGQSRSLLDVQYAVEGGDKLDKQLLTYADLSLRGVKKTWSPGEAVDAKGATEG